MQGGKRMETMQKAILGFALVIALGFGTVFASAAVTSKSPLDHISSITVSDNAADDAHEISETQEAAQLTNLAKITEEEAKTAAIRKIGVTVNKVELENENGNVVYSVEMTKNNKETDVKIDAGNGKVLKIDDGVDDEKESKLTKKEADNDKIEDEFEGEEKQ
jgi:uncharacterized membrane protein YkoI